MGNASGLVVVLGNEDRGMPVELIENMNACIEIPQFGLTGNLNNSMQMSLVFFLIYVVVFSRFNR